MPSPGGLADKFGNRFEAKWGVQVMVRILLDRADSMEIESVLEDDKIEFVLTASGNEEAWQVKRQTSRDIWTLATLHSKGVISFLEQAFKQRRTAVFASMSDSPQLHDLIDRAGSSASLSAFLKQIKADKSNKNFSEFKEKLKTDEKTAFEILRNTQLEYTSERSLEKNLDTTLATLCDQPESAKEILFKFYFDSIGKRLYKDDVLNCLQRSGILVSEDRRHAIRSTITGVTKTYLDFQEQRLIGKQLIARKLSTKITEQLRNASVPQNIYIKGEAGCGKSGVLYEILTQL